jgi:hypothetical protein
MINTQELNLYVKRDNKFYKVTAICESQGEANAICALNESVSVIAELNNLIFLADNTALDPDRLTKGRRSSMDGVMPRPRREDAPPVIRRA